MGCWNRSSEIREDDLKALRRVVGLCRKAESTQSDDEAEALVLRATELIRSHNLAKHLDPEGRRQVEAALADVDKVRSEQ
jgi:uncharacterized protein DUF2786